MRFALACVVAAACGRSPTLPPPELVVVGESTRVRLEGPRAQTTAWFDGNEFKLLAARGEVLGLQVLAREPAPAMLSLDDAAAIAVRGFEVDSYFVVRPSTAMYGGSQGHGTYPDVLRPADTPETNPAYFEIHVSRDAVPGHYRGTLVSGERRVAVTLTVAAVTLPPLGIPVWSYGDPRELVWANSPTGDPPRAKPSATEVSCMQTFREHGVLLTPDVHLDWWPERKALLADVKDLPVWIPRDPAKAGEIVRAWIAETRGTGQLPFTIPIDEPRTPDKKAKVKELAAAVRAAGGGPTTFRYAVTDDIRPEVYGDLIDLYISLYAKRSDRVPRWTYQSAPPHGGSMVLDAVTPGTRTWGWIAWRWNIGLWYVWDALYWHDRHNRHGKPLPGKPMIAAIDPVSFDDGEDHGNFDGVLALPHRGGCRPTLRLAAIRRGMQDKQLLDLAARCNRQATEALAARMMPRALGDAPRGSKRSWSSDESVWEQARRDLIALAGCQVTTSASESRPESSAGPSLSSLP
jgi:hypothetical protein